MKKIKKLVIIFTAFVMLCSQYVTVSAYTKSVSKIQSYPTDNNTQYRFVTFTPSKSDAKWTGYHNISGQPKHGTWLDKGDMMFYQSNGGSNCSLSFGLGYGYGSISLSVPVGKMASESYGVAKKAKEKGWYKLKLNKRVKVTVKYIQTRNRYYNYPKGYVWSKWKKRLISKDKTILKEKAKLVKQKK